MNKRPRILIDAIAYSPRDGGFTTAMHDVLDACRALPEFEFVVVHARKHGPMFRSFGLATYAVAIPEKLRFFASLLLLPLIARRIKADAVHCEISALPRFLGVPGSVTVHDLFFMIEERLRGGSLARRVMRVYWERAFLGSVRRARVVKAISQTTADDLRRLVSSDLPILLVEPRVTRPRDTDVARRQPGPGEDLRLLFVGSIVPRRNLPFLLRSLQLVRRPWRLDVVGSPWWGMAELDSLASDERVHMHGYVPDSEREEYMASAHLLIAPSRYEGFGYPAAEAMVRGLPVLTSDIGAFRSFVPSDWRFPLDRPEVLASMIDAVDEDAYAEMARKGPDAVARFSPRMHVDRHRLLVERLVSKSGHQAASPPSDCEWRPGKLARLRALGRRAVIATLGDRAEGRLRAAYHRILRRVDRFGIPEDAATEAVLAAIAARSRTIIDVGANVGRYAWFLRRRASPQARLFALEPHPGSAALLRSAIGALPGSTVLEMAAADRDEIRQLVVPDGPFGSPVAALAWVASEPDVGVPQGLSVTTRRIDGLVDDGTISVVSPVFIKIDVEGGEGAVLRGSEGLLSRYHPVIYFECQAGSAARQGESPDRVWNLLEGAGYEIFATGSGRFVRVDRLTSDAANYLAIPVPVDIEVGGSPDVAAIVAIMDAWAKRGSEA